MMKLYPHRVLTSLAVAVILVAGAGAQTSATLQRVEVPATMKHLLRPGVKHTAPQRATSMTADIVAEEDFSGFTYGTAADPDMQALASLYDANIGYMLPDEMMSTPGWYGTEVFSAGGMCYLAGIGGYNPALIGVPMGDWSGDVTVTCRVKAVGNDGSTFAIQPVCGDYFEGLAADTDDTSGMGAYYQRFYPKDGWAQVTYSYRNNSSDPIGSIWFYCMGAMLLDDIKITISNADWIAEPQVSQAYNFTADGFTIDWSPVRKSFDYRVMLYRMESTGEGIEPVYLDFDTTTEAPMVDLVGGSVAAGQGVDGTAAMRFTEFFDGVEMVSPNAKLESFKVWVKGELDPSAADENLVFVDVLADPSDLRNGWVPAPDFGGVYGFVDLRDLNPEGEWLEFSGASFANAYYGVRVQFVPMDEGLATLYVDDFQVTGMSATELVEVLGPSSISGFYYAKVDDAYTYTFTGLDPDGDYYYAVRSHFQNMVSDSQLYHAFGVAAPTNLDATEIKSEPASYIVNFDLPANATGYEAETYGVVNVAQAGMYTVMEETFDGIDASVTSSTDYNLPDLLGNYSASFVDEHTDNPGWIGMGTAISQGMMGFTSAAGTLYLGTPPMNLVNDSKVKLTLNVYGMPDDDLIIFVGDATYGLPLNGAGEFNGSVDFTIDGDASHVQILFASMNMAPVMFDYVKVE